MQYETLKDRIIRYGYLIPDSLFIEYLNNYKDKNYTMYRKLFDDPDIKKEFGKRLENIKKNIIFDNNIKMETVEQAIPVQGILPTLTKQNSQDGPQPPITYVSADSPFVVDGISDSAGSKIYSVAKKINWPIVLLVAATAGGVAYLIYGEEFKKVKKHVKPHKK